VNAAPKRPTKAAAARAERKAAASPGRVAGAALLSVLGVASVPTGGLADESGVSFWAPGLYSSLAAVPVDPGWSWATVYYHTSADAGAGRTFLRGGRFEAGVSARADAVFFGPSYTFATPFLGAQASLSLLGVAGHIDASVDATLTGPRGNAISGQRSDARTVFGDLYPQLTLKRNRDVHNVLTYLTGNIPIGAYNPRRLANLGIGHGAIDAGGGYTYLNPRTGLEFSAVLGFTYNFENPDTKYKNGIDAHLDWGASYFVAKPVHVGLVGYLYNQITDDSGPGATLGGFRSRVAGIGPQVGYMFSLGERVTRKSHEL
jgi:hypothetical protein